MYSKIAQVEGRRGEISTPSKPESQSETGNCGHGELLIVWIFYFLGVRPDFSHILRGEWVGDPETSDCAPCAPFCALPGLCPVICAVVYRERAVRAGTLYAVRRARTLAALGARGRPVTSNSCGICGDCFVLAGHPRPVGVAEDFGRLCAAAGFELRKQPDPEHGAGEHGRGGGHRPAVLCLRLLGILSALRPRAEDDLSHIQPKRRQDAGHPAALWRLRQLND